MKKVFNILIFLIMVTGSLVAQHKVVYTINEIPNDWSFSKDTTTHYSTSYSRVFQKGVNYLQIVLKTDLSINISIDGGFGYGTKSAVKSFQGKYGLSQDGIVGRNTKVKLDAVLQILKGNTESWRNIKPVPLSPGNKNFNYQTIYTTTPTLRWQKVDGAPYYWVAIKDMDTGEQVFYSKIIVFGDTLSYKVPLGKLKKGHKYYWDLATLDTNKRVVHWTDESNRRYFKVKNDSTSNSPYITDINPNELQVTNMQYVELYGDNFGNNCTIYWRTSSGDSGSIKSLYIISQNDKYIKFKLYGVGNSSDYWEFKIVNPDGKHSTWIRANVNLSGSEETKNANF